MKNLKKILALVLAFACAFTMFAGAAFTDQADIKVDAEVVDTLVSLGVINGYTDGSFKPNDTVTRAEMAKMIYVLRTGNSDASAYNNDKTSFTDVNGHWAAGFIKYCQSVGIIAGQSATKFAPDKTVTAQEAAKMLLVTLGYDAQKAGLVGINWASRTNALADENGLLEDVTTSFTGPCPRQYAAQLIYNAIDASTVVWRDDAYTKYNYNGDENPTIGEKYMGLKYATGIMMASGKVGLDGTGASKALVVKADEKQTVLNTKYEANDLIKFTDIKTDYSEFLGMAVKVMYKDKDKVYGVYATDDNDEKVDAIFVNNKTFAKLTTVNSTSVSYKKVQLDMKGNTTGTAFKLDLEDDEPEIYDGYKKDDYVFVGADLYNDAVVIEKAATLSGKADSFKADSIKIDGKWHDYVLASGKTYTAKAGKTYTGYVYGSYIYYLTGESGSNSDVDTLLVKSVGDYKAMDEGVEAKVYFEDGTEKVINVTDVVTASKGFDLNDWNDNESDTDNKCTTETAKTAKKLTKLDANKLYAYDQDGSDYTLFVLDENFKAGDVKVAAKGAKVEYNDKTETFSGTEAEDAAPIFISYKNYDSYKVITGSALKNYDKMTGRNNSVVLADDDNVVAAYIDLEKGLSNTDTLYGVVKKSYSGTESNGTDTVIYLDMITSEGLKTVETEETGKASKFTKGMIVSFTGSYEKANDDIEVVSSTADNKNSGYIAIANDWSDSSKLVRAYDVYATKADVATPSKVISIAAGKVVSDSVVINIDEDNYKADDATPSKAEELSDGDGYYANAFVIVNSDNEIELLVYETANRIKNNDNKEIKLYTK